MSEQMEQGGAGLTVRQQYILELVDQAQEQSVRVADAKIPYSEAQTEANRLHKIVKDEEEKLEDILDQIVEAKKDRPLQGNLFNQNGQAAKSLVAAAATAADPAKTAAISELKLSKSLTEKLEAAEITTVGVLEERMRTDQWWHRKIKGCGQTAVDKISDALFAWRKMHPVPSADSAPATEQGQGQAGAVTLGETKTFEVTLPKKLNASAFVLWAQASDGTFRAGIDTTETELSGDTKRRLVQELNPDGESFATREAALIATLARMAEWWFRVGTKASDAIAKAIAKSREALIAASQDDATEAPKTESPQVPAPAAAAIETLDVPASDPEGVKLCIRLLPSANGIWRGGFGYSCTSPQLGFASEVSEEGPTFGTREEAIQFYANMLQRECRDNLTGNSGAMWQTAVGDLAEFLKAFQKKDGEEAA
jgi:hypothetical protein